MYKKQIDGQLSFDLPFGVALNTESKWHKFADMFPWERIEKEYAKHFTGKNEGQIAKSARLAFGALYIQSSEGFTDAQTRTSIWENPYMQYFCGFDVYSTQPPFDESLMVHFRKRIPAEMIMQITAEVFGSDALSQSDAPEDKLDSEDNITPSENNKGTLILDATCCPQDIHYPTDIGLLNQARELSEQMIDKLYKTVQNAYEYKPRTYRRTARKDYLAYTKTRKHTASQISNTVRKQLQYVSRNLRTIDDLVSKGAPLLTELGKALYRKLFVIHEVYRQQQEMHDQKTNRCDGRIVSISQPHIRPIVRGKDHNPTEFGSKVAIGLVGGFAFITNLSWENIPEASVLSDAAEQYHKLFGFYPKVIIGDRAYPNRNNRQWCKEHGIRLSSPALGRKSEEEKQAEKAQLYRESCERNAVEGAFGTAKRKYGLDRIMPKLPETSLTAVAMGFFAANMERKLRLLFAPFSPCFVFYDFSRFGLSVRDCL